MTILLNRIRILLVSLPAVISIADIEPGSYAAYVAYVLLALLLIKLEPRSPNRAIPFLLLESTFFAWLSYTYDGVLFLLLFSTLIAIYRSKSIRLVKLALTVMGLAALTAGVHSRESELIIAIVMLGVTVAVILYAANEFEDRQHKTEELYDALALSHEELNDAKRRMQVYASHIEQYAQTEERNRIAKDIHDDLGHRLIRVKMMSEAALQLFDVDTTRAKGMVEQIRDQLQDSMERMRRTVRRLASPDDGDTRRYALDRLVEDSADALGITVSFQVIGFPRPLYPSMELILYKNAQEAITNAVRHGRASAVTVELHFLTNSVALTISNNGIVPNEPIKAGLGMRGMRERIALIGGRLEWQRTDSFSVTTILPLLGGTTSVQSSSNGG